MPMAGLRCNLLHLSWNMKKIDLEIQKCNDGIQKRKMKYSARAGIAFARARQATIFEHAPASVLQYLIFAVLARGAVI